jgi:hypothetical protein
MDKRPLDARSVATATRIMRKLSSLVVLLLVAACSKEKPTEPAKPAAVASVTTDEKPATKKPKLEAPKKEPTKKADADKLATYWKSMSEGRKATLAKKYDDAYAAFDKALVAMPDDARAISERGYAKLLAKDFPGALADLDHAVARTKDRKLLGQIYYNYGLAAEGKGDAAAARAAFARSNEYNPTPAAKKKLDGKAACTAIIAAEMPASSSKKFASWKEAYDGARKDFDQLPAWSSEAATLATFCSNKWSKGAACIAALGNTALMEGRVYTPGADGKISMHELGLVGGRCGGSIDAKLVLDEGDVTHVSWTASQGISTLVAEKNGEMAECTEKDSDCMSVCANDEVTYADLFIAKDIGESMLYVGREAENDKDPIKVSVEMPVVTIKGKGCDTERPLAR